MEVKRAKQRPMKSEEPLLSFIVEQMSKELKPVIAELLQSGAIYAVVVTLAEGFHLLGTHFSHYLSSAFNYVLKIGQLSLIVTGTAILMVSLVHIVFRFSRMRYDVDSHEVRQQTDSLKVK